jgi:putative transposase
LMTNHFHLLLKPNAGESISRILQSLTVAHTWRYRKAHKSVGHVWQGRFKSPPVQGNAHAVTVLRYIEANPLRAGMVTDLASYPWSSYRVHGLGQADPLVSALPGWNRVGRDEPARQAYWRKLVQRPLSERELAAVRRSVVSGRPYGSERWTRTTAVALGLRLIRLKRTWPRGWRRSSA